jgi:acetyl esterase
MSCSSYKESKCGVVMRSELPKRLSVGAGLRALAAWIAHKFGVRQNSAPFVVMEGLEYARPDGVALHLDILQPNRPGPHPVMLYLHSGGCAVASKRNYRAMACAYAAQGYLVCNIDYRLTPQHPFPAALQDACAAWMWAANHIDVVGGDPHRMALAGDSVGANLALAVTLACCTPRPEKFAKPLFNRGLRPGAALLYYGFLQSSCSERALPNSLGNPLCVVERMTCEAALPPIFIASGLNDSLLADSQRMERALRSRSSPCTACYYPGKGYAFHVAHWRTQAPRCWRDSFRFLQQNLPIDAVLEA